MIKWKISIPDGLGGFAPGWYLDTYPSYGNKNMAGDMQHCDLMNPGCITQGPSLSEIKDPSGGAVKDLLRGILDFAVSSNVTYAIGGDRVLKLNATNILTGGPFPHTISGTSVTGEDMVWYKGDGYYSWQSASANVGRLTGTAFRDDWGTVSASASISAGVPLPLEVGGNDFLYLGNKHRISDYDGTTWTNEALDLPNNCEIQDIKWTRNRLWIAVNRNDLSGTNKSIGSIFTWDGVASSWEDELVIGGRIGALYIKNGIVYVFYQDITNTGGYKLGYLQGTQVTELSSFTGSLPAYYQVSEYKGFITWVSDGEIWSWGAIDSNLPPLTIQLADGGLATVGGLACPFGTPIVASHDNSTTYQLNKFAGYSKDAQWKSLMFPVGKSNVDKIVCYHDTPGTGARARVKMTTDRGRKTYTLGNISAYGLNSRVFEVNAPIQNDFRVEYDWTSGSSANPLKINRTEIYGQTYEI